MKLHPFVKKTLAVINKYQLIQPNDSIIVGVSGGPDSVALLKTLCALNSEENLRLRLYVAHLNHQLRGDFSEEDAQFVQNLSKELSLPFISKRVNIRKIASETKLSLEETARKERYKFYLEASQSYNVSHIATGHTADDNAETLLHRIIRGTGVLGLGGIPIKRPLSHHTSVFIIRPLLFAWKSEILEYLKKDHTKYRIDASNYEKDYTRNKIRLELIPLLENKYNPNIKNALSQLSQILNINNEHLFAECKTAFENATIYKSDRTHILDTDFLLKQPKILQYLLLRKLLHTMDIPLKALNYGHYSMILEGLAKKGKNWRFQLPGKITLWHEQGKLFLEKELFQKTFRELPEIFVKIPGMTQIGDIGSLTAELLERSDISLEKFKSSKTNYEELLDFECIKTPVIIRNRRNGDTISPLGTHGHKKLKKLFIDKKIPWRKRNHIPIVSMNNQPIWAVGVCLDDSVKITPGTKKVLKLTFHTHRKNNPP
ncbi:MAG: tRNA lysidine(34) synthetase TilS [Candidatus Kuenenia sp.]|nr:tRNA lysidine(34) synthetase TilS [Candidatus Kuenenia hertensis]